MRVAHGVTMKAERSRRVLNPGDRSPEWLRTAAGWTWRLLVIFAGVVLVFMAIVRLQELFVGLFIAAIFTAILRPFADWLAKYMPRPAATLLAFVSSILGVTGVIAFIIISVSGQWENLSQQFVTGIGEIQRWIESLQLPFLPADQTLTEWVNSQLENVTAWIQQNSGAIAGQVASSLGTVAVIVTTIILALVLSVFFVNGGDKMWDWVVSQFPKKNRERLELAGTTAWDAFSGYTRGIVLLAASNALLAGIVIAVMRVPLALVLAVLVFFGTFIPIVGAPLAMMVAAVVALAANGPLSALIVMIGIALMGQVTSQILEPFIMGHSVNLHPVVVIVSVVGGTLLLGVLGAVIAVPIVAVVWKVYSALRPPPDPSDEVEDIEVEAPRRRKRWFMLGRPRAKTS